LKQVLYNYLSNAIKFTPEAGRVSVRVFPEGGEMFRVEVEDSGIGIREEDLERLFVEFQQLDSSSTKKYQGTGLGLALTRRIVEAQGGRVEVRSTPGKGSVFAAILPKGQPSPIPPPMERPSELVPGGAAHRGTVLVIEDEPADAAWITATLKRAGYEVETATTASQASELCCAKAYDAITLDLLLPDAHGSDVLRDIRTHGRNQSVPVIVVSVLATEGVGVGFALHDMFMKPVRSEDLLASLRRAGLEEGSSQVVLVVDDDPNPLKLLEPSLRERGYRAIGAVDGESGLILVSTERPSAVIVDLVMPGMSGFEFLHRLRKTPGGLRIPAIVWTVKDLTPEEKGRLEQTAQAVVQKGTDGMAALLSELEAHVFDRASKPSREPKWPAKRS